MCHAYDGSKSKTKALIYSFHQLNYIYIFIRKEGFGSLERKYLWEDISQLSKSENIQECLIRWVPVSIYTATEELRPKTEN